MLFDILYSTRDLEIQEDIVQLLWDLESTAEVTSSKVRGLSARPYARALA